MSRDELRAGILKIIEELNIPQSLDPFAAPALPPDIGERLEPLLKTLSEIEIKYTDILGDSATYMRLAILCYFRGRYDAAARYAEKAVSPRGGKLDARFVQAMANLKLQEYKKAIGYFDEILEQNDKNWIVWFFKGESLRMRKLFDRAVESYKNALLLEKGRSEPWVSLGKALTDMGRMEDAAKAFLAGKKAGDSAGKDAKIRQMLDEAKQKRLPQMLENVIKLAPESVEAWLALSAIYKANEDYKSAMKYFSDALKIDPANKTAKAGYDESMKAWKKRVTCKKCSGSGKCTECGGKGDCEECEGSGKCTECEGSKECMDCDGSGKCPDCNGKGRIKLIKTCKTCEGTGKCVTCKGRGRCPKCKGSGKCLVCSGKKKCTECEGSGKCVPCKGEGIKE